MAVIDSVEYKRRWGEIHFILEDLCKNKDKIDAVCDIIYKLVWDND